MPELIRDDPVPGGMPEGGGDSLISERRYRRILLAAVLSVSFVAIVPLIIATGINYYQYQEAFREEQSRPMVRFAANGKLALDMGGIHTRQTDTIDFDAQAGALSITPGEVYRLDLFHAERHTSDSYFRIETTIDCLLVE